MNCAKFLPLFTNISQLVVDKKQVQPVDDELHQILQLTMHCCWQSKCTVVNPFRLLQQGSDASQGLLRQPSRGKFCFLEKSEKTSLHLTVLHLRREGGRQRWQACPLKQRLPHFRQQMYKRPDDQSTQMSLQDLWSRLLYFRPAFFLVSSTRLRYLPPLKNTTEPNLFHYNVMKYSPICKSLFA